MVEVALKLKTAECHFARMELGLVVSQEGLKINPRLIEVAREFSTLKTAMVPRSYLIHLQGLLPTFSGQGKIFSFYGSTEWASVKDLLASAPVS